MKMSDLIRICYGACPKEIAWSPHELYGEYNIEDHNKTVKKVLYCVTPTQQVLAHFRKHGYDLLISHHPYLTNVPQLIFHTALDCVEIGGLNTQWRDAIGMLPGYCHFDGTLGWVGEIPPVEFTELINKVKNFAGKIDGQIYLDPSIKKIKSVVICSGLGGLVAEQALETGADCFLLGESLLSAEEMGFKATIEVGHTASEWCGVNLFRDILKGVQVDLTPATLDVFGKEFYRPNGRKHKEL